MAVRRRPRTLRTLPAVLSGAALAATALAGCSFAGSVGGSGGHHSRAASTASATSAAPGSPPSSSAAASPATAPASSGPASSTAAGSSAASTAPTRAATTAASTSPGASASPAPCRTGSLRVALDEQQGAGAGMSQDRVLLQFTNTGSATCTLDGHPGVSYVTGDDGHQVGAGAQRSGSPALVALAPGAVAHADLDVVDAGVFPTSACHPTAVRGLRVYPPDQKASTYVARAGTGCASTSAAVASQLGIGPVQAGATDS